MVSVVELDEGTNRKFFLDSPDDLQSSEQLIFLLNLHGGGSHGTWQHKYFPAHEYCNEHRLVVATPSAETREPTRRWVAEADDGHLQNIVERVLTRFGKERIRAFWLVGHSQGGMTSHRLLHTEYFAIRVDGWLSLSGGRIGPAPRAENAGRPPDPGRKPAGPPATRRPPTRPADPDCDFSFIYSVGEHEIASLPDTSPWADKYGADARVQLADVVDVEGGQIYDTTCDGYSNRAWGLKPKPGTAQVFVYPNARGGRVIADIVRIDKGHTEGFEPAVTNSILKLLVQEPGGKLPRQ